MLGAKRPDEATAHRALRRHLALWAAWVLAIRGSTVLLHALSQRRPPPA